ncbi:hypothetical protein CHARACLAT_017797 [Characodon lateralis]|uniref:Voltage-dependent calcium channel alpha-2/delta subunit conserved region domain-containing protein n=1 Tax=Characodon lateralis TaxID=208331 RepID=A0ABU7DV54_9TELE|nr:hypothetical protein [Characodon lateralis]
MGMFKKVSLFDYQAMCKNSHHHASSARSLLSPLYMILALMRWFFSNAVMFLLDFNLCGLWHSDYLVDAKAGYHTSHKQKKVEALQPCDTAYPGFMYDSSIREANSLIKCGRCQKMFVVQQIPDSNLVLVVTQASCDCSRQFGPILLQPKEIKYILWLLNMTTLYWAHTHFFWEMYLILAKEKKNTDVVLLLAALQSTYKSDQHGAFNSVC